MVHSKIKRKVSRSTYLNSKKGRSLAALKYALSSALWSAVGAFSYGYVTYHDLQPDFGDYVVMSPDEGGDLSPEQWAKIQPTDSAWILVPVSDLYSTSDGSLKYIRNESRY